MGSNEGHTDSSYNPAKSLAFDCPDSPLYCACGVILAPHELRLDLGDGPELLCDACLGLSN